MKAEKCHCYMLLYIDWLETLPALLRNSVSWQLWCFVQCVSMSRPPPFPTSLYMDLHLEMMPWDQDSSLCLCHVCMCVSIGGTQNPVASPRGWKREDRDSAIRHASTTHSKSAQRREERAGGWVCRSIIPTVYDYEPVCHCQNVCLFQGSSRCALFCSVMWSHSRTSALPVSPSILFTCSTSCTPSLTDSPMYMTSTRYHRSCCHPHESSVKATVVAEINIFGQGHYRLFIFNPLCWT